MVKTGDRTEIRLSMGAKAGEGSLPAIWLFFYTLIVYAYTIYYFI
jgi:hypothetical protein